jgi:hypothetical protein
MKKMKKFIRIIGILVTGVLISVNLSSCTSNKTVTASEQGGAQLWANNCVRCHNMPPPNAFSDYEWDAIANHMQKIAGFTATDVNKVAEFLKSANH